MSSSDNIKNKLVNSMKMTKQGTAKTITSSQKKAEPAAKKPDAPAKKAAQPAKKATAQDSFSSASGCRVWPD